MTGHVPARQRNRGLLALLLTLRREPDLEPAGPTSLGTASPASAGWPAAGR